MHTTKSSQYGFTLVELIVAAFVFSLIIAAVYNVFDLHNRMAARQEETTAMQQELLSIMNQMADDLRMCGYSADQSKKHGFTEATAGSIVCTREKISTDDNRLVNATEDVIIGYRLNNADNTIQKFYDRGGIAPWIRTAEHIGNLQLTYFNTNGDQIPNPVANLQQIRTVEINATAIPSPQRANLGIHNRTMSTQVQIRNIR